MEDDPFGVLLSRPNLRCLMVDIQDADIMMFSRVISRTMESLQLRILGQDRRVLDDEEAWQGCLSLLDRLLHPKQGRIRELCFDFRPARQSLFTRERAVELQTQLVSLIASSPSITDFHLY